MKILYVCFEDSNDKKAWSGLVYYIRKALEQHFKIEIFDKIPFECPWYLRLYHRIYKLFSKKVHYLQLEPVVLKNAAKRIEVAFANSGCDAIFCPGSGIPLNAFLNPSIPVYTYLDATKQSWINTYFGLHTLSNHSQKIVRHVDRVGIQNNKISFFASEWAAKAAIDETGCDQGKFAVVPFGANIESPPDKSEVIDSIKKRDRNVCKLLFLGKDWERKGGEFTLLLLEELQRIGLTVELHIIGCNPYIPPNITGAHTYGFIDRNTKEGNRKFHSILSKIHFLVYFSLAEAYGLALCEANAFGIPCLGTKVGGITTVIRENQNGFLYDVPLQLVECRENIFKLMKDFDDYEMLARSSREEYDNRLNWRIAGKLLYDNITHSKRSNRLDA